MNKLILTIMMFLSTNVFAHTNRYCPECYSPVPPVIVNEQPYVVVDEVEYMCITKMSNCTVGQNGSSFFYKFRYGSKETHQVVFSNGKTSKYTVRNTDTVKEYVDLSGLKSTNADVAVGKSDEKITDEKTSVLRTCISEQEVWKATYDQCR